MFHNICSKMNQLGPTQSYMMMVQSSYLTTKAGLSLVKLEGRTLPLFHQNHSEAWLTPHKHNEQWLKWCAKLKVKETHNLTCSKKFTCYFLVAKILHRKWNC